MNPGVALRQLAHLLVAPLVATAIVVPSIVFAQADPPTATVVAAGLNMRSGPGVSFDRVAQVTKDTVLPVIDQAQSCAWLKVTLADGREGWISGGAQYARLSVACSELQAAAESGAEPAPTARPTATPAAEPAATVELTLDPGTGLRERPAAELFAEISPSVAFIETPSGTGSGALVEHGFLLTNAHVVWPYAAVRVVFPSGAEYKDVPVFAWDIMADLALVGPLETDVKPIKLVDGGELEIGSNVYLIGYPAEVDEFPQPSITSGILSRVRNWEELNYTFFQVDATTVGGQSGGILVTHGGDVVGISTFYYRGFGLAGSVADTLPRLNALLGNDTGAILDPRPFPEVTGSAVVTGTLQNEMDSRFYVLREPAETEVDLRIEGVGRPRLYVSTTDWSNVGASEPVAEDSKEATVSFTIDEEIPYFVEVTQPSHNEHAYVLTSTHPLAVYVDPDDLRQLSVGETVTGGIDLPQDRDTFDITLKQGETITISVDGLKIDPAVAITYISDALFENAYDDDSGGGLFDQKAQLVYRAPADDTYQIVVTSTGYRESGGYVLRIEAAPDDIDVEEPDTHIELASGAYGGMTWYESEENDFAILHPMAWSTPPGGCGTGTTTCMVAENAGLIIVEESLEVLPKRQRNRADYLALLEEVMSSQPTAHFESTEVITTVQGLSADQLSFRISAGQVIAERLVYVDEEAQTAFSATVVMQSDFYDTNRPLIDHILESFRYWNTENITDTAAFQLDEGMRLNLTKEYTASIAAYTRAIELDPMLEVAYVRRGWGYYDQGEDEAARADLRQALALAPDDAEIQNSCAAGFWSLGETETAMTAIDEAIRLEPDYYSHYNLRAYIHAAQEDFDAALADIEKTAELNHGELPDAVKDTRAYLHLLMGEDESAWAGYAELLDDDRYSSYTLLGAGVAAFRMGDAEDGRRWLALGRTQLQEELEKGRKRFDPQLTQLTAWADELDPVVAAE